MNVEIKGSMNPFGVDEEVLGLRVSRESRGVMMADYKEIGFSRLPSVAIDGLDCNSAITELDKGFCRIEFRSQLRGNHLFDPKAFVINILDKGSSWDGEVVRLQGRSYLLKEIK